MAEQTIQVSADIGGTQISFAEVINAEWDSDEGRTHTEAAINAKLDLWTKAIGRQRSKIELATALVDLWKNHQDYASNPMREEKELANREIEKKKLIAKFEIAHNAQNRRAEFRLNDQQKKQVTDFDIETKALRERYAAERDSLLKIRPILQKQVERLKALIAGDQDWAERIGDLEGFVDTQIEGLKVA